MEMFYPIDRLFRKGPSPDKKAPSRILFLRILFRLQREQQSLTDGVTWTERVGMVRRGTPCPGFIVPPLGTVTSAHRRCNTLSYLRPPRAFAFYSREG